MWQDMKMGLWCLICGPRATSWFTSQLAPYSLHSVLLPFGIHPVSPGRAQSRQLTWYLSEWWASSEERGETTGDSPSRLMCTDNSMDWGERARQLLWEEEKRGMLQWRRGGHSPTLQSSINLLWKTQTSLRHYSPDPLTNLIELISQMNKRKRGWKGK